MHHSWGPQMIFPVRKKPTRADYQRQAWVRRTAKVSDDKAAIHHRQASSSGPARDTLRSAATTPTSARGCAFPCDTAYAPASDSNFVCTACANPAIESLLPD